MQNFNYNIYIYIYKYCTQFSSYTYIYIYKYIFVNSRLSFSHSFIHYSAAGETQQFCNCVTQRTK